MFFRKWWQGLRLYYIDKALFFFVVLFLIFFLLVFPLRTTALDLISKSWGEPLFLLSEGLAAVFSPWLAGSGFYGIQWDNWGEQVIELLTGVNVSNPFSLLCWELNLIDPREKIEFYGLYELEGGEEDFYLPSQEKELEDWFKIPEAEFPPVQLDGKPMILIYNTHNAESYRPTQGTDRLEGQNGGIAAVSQTLVQTLENKHRLKTIYSDVIHDYPNFNQAYLNSRQTVKQILQEDPQIQVVLDIHRDAGYKKRSDTLVKIQGRDCAKILIIVGAAHPEWKENFAFAQKLEKKAAELYPGLIKAVRLLKNRTYNQNLHSRALLLEMGSDLNKETDALESAKLMADVLAAVLGN